MRAMVEKRMNFVETENGKPVKWKKIPTYREKEREKKWETAKRRKKRGKEKERDTKSERIFSEPRD